MGDLDAAVIKRTQQTLGKYVKKPPLTEKLLTKPPFRFLHDVFNAVIKETRCFVGLYTPEELNSDNIKDRDDKMRFLQKMIDVIKIVSNKPLTVRTSKIVAGQEPEKTNELLQLMGEVIDKKLDWKSPVEQVLNGKGPEKATSSTKTDPRDKQVDKKNKDKTNEKSKDKENRIKDAKTKDIKKVGKTISPPTKSDKPSKKSTEAREVEKSRKIRNGQVPKDTKDKTVKNSEKSTEKTKLLKSRTDSTKEKSSSPNIIEGSSEPETVHLISNEPNLTLKTNLEGLGTIEPERGPSETPSKSNSIKNHRRSSKVSEQDLMGFQGVVDNNLALGMPTDAMEAVTELGSRKSSARRKKSSGSSRRSSANVAAREEREGTIQEPIKNIKDENDNMNGNILNKIPNGSVPHNKGHEEEPEVVQQSHTQQQKPKTIQAQGEIQSPAPPPTAVQPTPTEVRREHTFTRENSRESSTIANRPRTSLRPPSARPASARPGAPRRRDRNIEIVLQPNDQVKLSSTNVKLESFGDLDDDGENLVVIEDATTVNIGESPDGVARVEETDIEHNLEQQGHLVQQILETQKELMQQPTGNSSNGKNEKDTDLANNLIGRQSSARQMNNLRDVIQNLTKSVNPFGKLMDFIPEDIDAMQLELTMWRDTYTQVANELRREKSLTESATEPMKNQLVQIEANIKEFIEMIDASRTKILQSSEKILKMLADQ
ncbi:TRAF3-interacting protein 1 [Anastrepha ludens]|uniref:TRAF3-interacting protein 1 n=1 Tax=Anastrepha ludens TaxID=28586 RepID=UPI0023B100E4|nr:TRAF3-interacting protein 1 [Anastrepha ludens]